MCDLLLVNSPLYFIEQEINEDYLPPMGLAYIATYVASKGKNVVIIDAIDMKIGVVKLVSKINLISPEFIGINIFSVNYDIVKTICESLNCNINILIGGNLTTFIYKDICKWKTKAKTYVVIGEGERIVYDIISNNIKEQPIYTENNFLVFMVDAKSKYFIHNLDYLSLNREFIKNEYFNVHGQIENSIVTSRGCPYNCAYCGSARSINKHTTVRRRSISSIEQELTEIENNNENVTCIRVLDDLFLSDCQSISDAIEMFSKHQKLSWRAMAHINTLKKAKSLFNSLYNSGCEELFIGIESGSEKIRELIHKKGNIHDIISVIQALLSSQIQVKAYFILGFPTENEDDMEATYRLAKKLYDFGKYEKVTFRVTVFKFRPYHGTELYKYIINQGVEIQLTHDSQNYGKDSFNFTAGNFSCVSDEKIEEYMIKMETMRGE